MDEELLERVMAGDERARAELVARLHLVVRGAIRIELRPWPQQRIGSQGADDLYNEVFAMLFADGAKAIGKWDLGQSSIETIGRIYARHRVRDIGKKERRRLELAGRPVSTDEAVEPEGGDRPDEIAETRQFANAIIRCVRVKFTTAEAAKMINLILIQSLTDEELQRRTGRTKQQIYRWRSRLLQRARECFYKLRRT